MEKQPGKFETILGMVVIGSLVTGVASLVAAVVALFGAEFFVADV